MGNTLNQTVYSDLFFRKIGDVELYTRCHLAWASKLIKMTAIGAILSRRSHEKIGDCEQSKFKCSLVKLFDMSYFVPLFTPVFHCVRLIKHPRNYFPRFLSHPRCLVMHYPAQISSVLEKSTNVTLAIQYYEMRCKLDVGTFIAVHVFEVYLCEYKKVSTSLHLTGDEVKLRHQRKYICVHLKVIKPT